MGLWSKGRDKGREQKNIDPEKAKKLEEIKSGEGWVNLKRRLGQVGANLT